MTTRRIVAASALALLLAGGSTSIGPLPPLGSLLDPASGFWAVARTAELPTESRVRVPGLEGSVEVVYDRRSVPHIFARTTTDAYRALGYVVARDRLFQLEVQTRATGGTLSEMFGADALGFDRSQRALGLAASAERDYRRLPPTSGAALALSAYADGVNARIDALGPDELPLEFRLLDRRPSVWRSEYSLYLLKRMGWTLAYGRQEIWRPQIDALVGRVAADALFPVNSPIQEPIQPNGTDQPRFDAVPLPPPRFPPQSVVRGSSDTASAPTGDRRLPLRLRSLEALGAVGIGSNNWAVAPRRTEAGHALLAGDPHLELTLPSIWYEAHLVVPGVLDVYGVTIPGVPAIVIGFNRDVAWSFTNTEADVIDYYRETLDDQTAPTRYQLDGEWHELARRVETYYDRGGDALAVETFYATHRGPILPIDGVPFSIRWTVLEDSFESVALMDVARALSVSEVLDAMERYGAPAQNVVVADRQGEIALRSTGRFPVRPGDGDGTRAREGTERSADWIGHWPVSSYPLARNPDRGFVSSANQQPIDPMVNATYLGANWPSPWRAMRINQLLRDDAAVTPDRMRRFQTDPGSPRADLFVPAFVSAASLAADADLAEAARLLADWDRRYTKGNERAILFELAMDQLEHRAWDELLTAEGGDGQARLAATPREAVLASLLRFPESVWWDDRRTPDVTETRDDILRASLAAALVNAKARYGEPATGGWRWDRIRHANIYHLTRLPSLSALGLPVRGGPSTLNPSSGSGTYGASWRMVVELGPEVRAWGIYPGGQSGNPVSSRYVDRLSRWIDGQLDTLLIPREPFDLPAEDIMSTLIVEPQPAK